MEKPKPPASSQIRRPSTRPYARRKREAQAADAALSPTEIAAQVSAEIAEAIRPEETKAETAKAKAKPRARGRGLAVAPVAAIAPIAALQTPATDTIDLAAVDAAVAAVILDETVAVAASFAAAAAALLVESAAPVEPIFEAATAPLTRPITAALSNPFAETALATVEALAAAEPTPAPVTSLAQLSPQEISETSAASLSVLSAALQLTELPSPRQLPRGTPTDEAPPPGLVPRGDSRSLRRGELFALVYRVHSFVITRHGKVGQLGHWSAIEYPTPSAASHAYARGCSHWVSEGFSDYRG
jgi:hypothetical protein